MRNAAPNAGPPDTSSVRDALLAGAAASVLAGVPSTLHALATRHPLLENATAAGSILLPDARDAKLLVAAAVPVHLALSFGWAQVIAAIVPRERPVLPAIGCGLAIAALDLGVIGQHIPRIRSLPQLPQWLDHVAYGATVGAVLRIRWRSRAGSG